MLGIVRKAAQIILRNRDLAGIPKGSIYVAGGYKLFDSKQAAYTNNLQYCSAVLVSPRGVKDGDDFTYAFAHYDASRSYNKYSAEIPEMIDRLSDANNVDPSVLDAMIYSILYLPDLNPAFSTLAAKSNDSKFNIFEKLKECGVLGINFEQGSSLAVKTNGFDIVEVGKLTIASQAFAKRLDSLVNGKESDGLNYLERG